MPWPAWYGIEVAFMPEWHVAIIARMHASFQKKGQADDFAAFEIA